MKPADGRLELETLRERLCSLGCHPGFGLAHVIVAKQDRAAQVGKLYPVEVDDQQMAGTQQGQVLDRLVAQSACASYQEPGAL